MAREFCQFSVLASIVYFRPSLPPSPAGWGTINKVIIPINSIASKNFGAFFIQAITPMPTK